MNPDIAFLPRVARDLIDLLGFAKAMSLIDRYQGTTIVVARGKRARGLLQQHEIAGVIGMEAAKKFQGRYGGAPLPVPKCYRAMLAARDASLQARFDELTKAGSHSARTAVTMLVSEFDLVESSIWRALKRPAGEAAVTPSIDDKQSDLFAA